MKDWLLLPVMAAVFALGYYLIRRLDLFIEDNQRQITVNERSSRRPIRIGAETPGLLDDISAVVAACSDTIPYLELFLSCGRRKRLFEKLADGSLDLILLRGEEERKGMGSMVLVWDKEKVSKDRDRVIFMIENDISAVNHAENGGLD